MKKLLTILVVATLISSPAAYATTATGPNLSTPLSATATVRATVLGTFYLIVLPDLIVLEFDPDYGALMNKDVVLVTAGSGEVIDWHLKVDCSDFSDGAAVPTTFEPNFLELTFYPGKDASNLDKGDVLNGYDQAQYGAPVTNIAAAVYKPKDAYKQATHPSQVGLFGPPPAASAGTYNATLTFQMVAGLPA